MKSLVDIMNLQNPVGKILSEWERPNGLHIKKPGSATKSGSYL